jgi:hypothetical protein
MNQTSQQCNPDSHFGPFHIDIRDHFGNMPTTDTPPLVLPAEVGIISASCSAAGTKSCS